jgi:hypothetical protein
VGRRVQERDGVRRVTSFGIGKTIRSSSVNPLLEMTASITSGLVSDAVKRFPVAVEHPVEK